MTGKEEFDFFVEQLLESTVREFKATEQYSLLREKLEHMERNCDNMLMEDEKSFVIECFELLKEVEGQQEHYVYRNGLKDGVKILKWLGVIA